MVYFVREAVCKGLITRSQLNGGFVCQTEMSSSSHLRALSLFPPLIPTKYNKYSCGQILYAFLLRPDTLPRSYITWLVITSFVITIHSTGLGSAKLPKSRKNVSELTTTLCAMAFSISQTWTKLFFGQ